MRMIDNDEVGLKTARRFIISLFGTAHSGMRRVVTPWGSVVWDAHHWRDQPFYAIPKQLQWQSLESLGEDKFVMQLGALHIKHRCPLMIPNLMVALSLLSMTTTSGSHGTCIDYHNFICFWINEKCILGCQFMSKSCWAPSSVCKLRMVQFFHKCKLHYQAYEKIQSTPRALGDYDNMPMQMP